MARLCQCVFSDGVVLFLGRLRLRYRSITLPLADFLEDVISVPIQSQTLSRKNSAPMPVWRVLVVDDSKALRDAVNRLLADLPGWQICGEATNGREAIEKALELEPDVILMDVGMPELDGLEATRRIRQRLDVEVLIFTQYDNRQAGQEALAAGARGFLPKSRAANLVEALEAVVQHQNYPAHGLENSVASGSSC